MTASAGSSGHAVLNRRCRYGRRAAWYGPLARDHRSRPQVPWDLRNIPIRGYQSRRKPVGGAFRAGRFIEPFQPDGRLVGFKLRVACAPKLLLDGLLTKTTIRPGDSWTCPSHGHRSVQFNTPPCREPARVSHPDAARSTRYGGKAHDTGARVWTDNGYRGAGGTVTVPHRDPWHDLLTGSEQSTMPTRRSAPSVNRPMRSSKAGACYANYAAHRAESWLPSAPCSASI